MAKNIFQKIKFLYTDNLYYFIPYLIFLSVGLIIMILFSQKEIFLSINGNNSPFLDVFFKYATNIGDGIFYLIIIILLLFIKVRYGIFGFLAYISSGLGAQLVKRFADTPRPKSVFAGETVLHFIEGVKVYSAHSFPSGHSASAFSLFLLLAIIVKPRWLGALFLLFALLVGISRIYLAQHFFIDVYFGSIIGVFFTILFYLIIIKNCNIKADNKLDMPLLKIFFVKKK